MKETLTADQARELLTYDPDTGSFFWRVSRGGRPAGSRAGHLQEFPAKGSFYYTIRLKNRLYLAHRLAWLIMHGEFPSKHIDHANGDSLDNRLSNLREATRSQNMQNKRASSHNKSGHKGVSWDGINRKWVARIREPKGKYLNLGRYRAPELAHAAYCEAAHRMFGEFARGS